MFVLSSACDGEQSIPPAEQGSAGQEPGIVALAPHLAELVYAAGAGDLLVGTSSYTDFPGYPGDLPEVGDAFGVDQEALAMLEPDLLLAWGGGTPRHVIDELRDRGWRVEVVGTRSLGEVPEALETIGRLTGRQASAARAAGAFRNTVAGIKARYGDAPSIRVFYQISARPLYTVNGRHYASELIALCGGTNVFEDLSELAPLVDVEAVLARDPEVLLAGSDSGRPFEIWDRWPRLAANRYGNRFLLPADEIGRATPRLLEAGERLCGVLEEARRNRGAAERIGSAGQALAVPDHFLSRFLPRQAARQHEQEVREAVEVT